MYCPGENEKSDSYEVPVLPSLLYMTLSPFDTGAKPGQVHDTAYWRDVQNWCRLVIYIAAVNIVMFMNILEAYLLIYLSYDLLNSIRNPISSRENKIPKFAVWAVISQLCFFAVSSILQTFSSFWEDDDSLYTERLKEELFIPKLTKYIFTIGIYLFVIRVVIGVYFGVIRRKGLSISVKQNIMRKHVSFLVLKMVLYFPQLCAAYTCIYNILW